MGSPISLVKSSENNSMNTLILSSDDWRVHEISFRTFYVGQNTHHTNGGKGKGAKGWG